MLTLEVFANDEWVVINHYPNYHRASVDCQYLSTVFPDRAYRIVDNPSDFIGDDAS